MDQYITFFVNHPYLSGAWVVLAVMIIFTTIKVKMSSVKQISPQELTFLVNRESGVVLDTRNTKEFNTSHILGAKNISSEKINNNDFSSLEKDKAKPIIVVCTAGITAAKVADQLVKAGFSQVNLLKGGMNAWLGAGLPVTNK